MSGVCQRTKDIEDGTNADLATCGADVFHRRVVRGSEHEAEADLSYAARNLLRTEIDTCPQSFQYIRAATATGGGTIAVFCYGCASRCDEDTRSGRDIKRTGTVTTCAAGIKSLCRQVPFQVYLYRFITHDTRHASDLLDGFPTWAQAQRRQ